MPLFLIRHGESEGNALRVVQGQGGDYALTARGREQAQSVGKLLDSLPVISIFSSPLRRARETAELIVASLTESISEASSNNLISFELTYKSMRDYQREIDDMLNSVSRIKPPEF